MNQIASIGLARAHDEHDPGVVAREPVEPTLQVVGLSRPQSFAVQVSRKRLENVGTVLRFEQRAFFRVALEPQLKKFLIHGCDVYFVTGFVTQQ